MPRGVKRIDLIHHLERWVRTPWRGQEPHRLHQSIRTQGLVNTTTSQVNDFLARKIRIGIFESLAH